MIDRIAAAVVAALFPLLWEKLEPVIRDVLAKKLDELIPDQIDKALPEVFAKFEERAKAVVEGLGGGLFGGLFK